MNPSRAFVLKLASILMIVTQIYVKCLVVKSNISTQSFKIFKIVDTRSDNITNNYENLSGNDTLILQRPLFPLNRNKQLPFNPSNYKCNQKHSPMCQNKTILYREKLLSAFKTSMLNDKGKPNYYNVEYEQRGDPIKYNPSCMILDAKIRYLTNSDTPFDTSEIGCLFPKDELFDKRFLSSPKSCIIVSSAGSMHSSGLGNFIGICVFLKL